MAKKTEMNDLAATDEETTDYDVPLFGEGARPTYATVEECKPPEARSHSFIDRLKHTFGWRGSYSMDHTPPRRTVYINDLVATGKFSSNKINTAKYSIITFIPKFLYEQFRKYANVFFLLVSLLQQIPGVSPTGRFNTAIPLLIVLSVSAIKEIIEDIARHRANNQVNSRRVSVLRDGKWILVYWTEVKVGDIVKVYNEEFFPADLLLLSSSEPEGHSYIETSNLDGETNLKIRQSHVKTMRLMHLEELYGLQGHVECEGPNNKIYKFHGNLKVGKDQLVPIEPEQILLRGARLRNTNHVHGLVIYTGHDSKLLQNATRAPIKRSNVEKLTNRQILVLFGVLMFLVLISACGQLLWNVFQGYDHHYLILPTGVGQAVKDFFFSFLTFIILYNNLIPISLIVTLEVVRFIQAIFIRKDLDMYHAETDTPALARTSNLNEELGQVKHVFSDKTGTLTRNVMQFKTCSIGGCLFAGKEDTSGHFVNDKLQDLINEGGDTRVTTFIKIMALCHTVIPEQVDGQLEYRASSPDEGALVKAASDLGIVFVSRTPSTLTIEVNGWSEEYELLNILPFNSDRKRMSVILRTPEGEIKLLIKGADSVIYERLQSSTDDLANTTMEHLDALASEGFRTLCFAEATLDPAAYEEWSILYYEASIAKVDREDKIDETAELIEKNLTLLGATAVEDKLQEGVPESIAKLQEAGIKVWVLTGDKKQTAINIGLSCNQLTPDTKQLVVTEASLQEVEDKLNSFTTVTQCRSKEEKLALIITGQALEHALSTSCSQLFLNVAMSCGSVICCRVTPLQKAQVVQLVKAKVEGSITLAIGDGANDVSMIQAAHVGIGISGLEGLQATLASDYAIAQFRYLIKLLFVHGAWNYRRLTNVILYSFYKNICLYLMQFWFAFFNGFSGQVFFERWTIGAYNVIFTLLPPLALGLMDQDISSKTRIKLPRLYKSSQSGQEFNARVLWVWIGNSIFHSLILFFVTGLALWHGVPFSDGKVCGLWFTGNTVYTATVITVVLKAGLHIYHWDLLSHICIWGSILSWFAFVPIYAQVWPTLPIGSEMIGLDSRLFGTAVFYALIVLVPCIALAPDVLYKIVSYQLGASLLKSVQRQEYGNKRPVR